MSLPDITIGPPVDPGTGVEVSYSSFNYSLTSKLVRVIPLLDDVLAATAPDPSHGPYNKVNFVQFLSSSHCLENLEFIVELDCFQRLLGPVDPLTHWRIIYRAFFLDDLLKEINLPHVIKCRFSEDAMPLDADLACARNIIYELLLDSYNEFIKHTKATQDGANFRRRLEIIPPELPPQSAGRKLHSKPPIPRSVQLLDSPETLPVEQFVDETPLLTRNNSTATNLLSPTLANSNLNASSRGSSIGSIVEGLKNNDHINWVKAVRKFKFRRFLNDMDYHSEGQSPP